jgi:diguanylate cyclase (GGDEF)-like protein/PAS domain S-box-containing protein
MKNMSLKFKIIIIFSIPISALFYFSYYFIDAKVQNLHESSMYKLSANITKHFSDLLLNLQVERGLSSGYLVSENTKEMKQTLLNQHDKTDKAYKKLFTLINKETESRQLIYKKIGKKNKLNIAFISQELHKLPKIREAILKKEIDFNQEMQFYTNINISLIKSIENLAIVLRQKNYASDLIPIVQNLKEYAGLERACIYNKILSSNNSQNCNEKAIFLQNKQDEEIKAYMLNASTQSVALYEKMLTHTNQEKIATLRKKFFNNTLELSDAKVWFKESSYRINQIEKISDILLKKLIALSNKFHQDALSSLYFTAFVWLVFLSSLSFLFLLLLKLIKKEELYTRDLSISACTFDSYEAITITDAQGNILKINNGFTRITGYTQEDVLGKNPRVLKSFKHQENYYKKMWTDINTIGRWSSNIYNKRKNGEIYLERLTITAIKNDKNEVTHYIGQFLDISELQNAQNKAIHQANHDFLTGIANRKHLMKRLNEEFVKARRHKFLHAFLFIDLDNFKNVNDSYGHTTGDMLIQEVSKRLKKTIREDDFLARISGDEFAILLLNIDKDEPVAARIVRNICSKILLELSKDYFIDNKSIHISSSIGIKLFPDGERNSEDVIVHADTAMYRAKDLGKNQFVFFDKEIEQGLKRLTLLEEEIKTGLKNDQFELYFQPKVQLDSGKICGAELLSRWNHPTKGLLYPGEYIETVNTIGLLNEFTMLALTTASKFLAEHKTNFLGTLAINLNSKELLHPEFEKKIIELVNHYKVDPAKIELEITEDELIKNFSLAVKKIKRLQDFGLRFSIDDFGTGYSSITYLQKLPVNSLKIDKAFFTDIKNHENKELIRTIINMAKVFDMSVVAEGIETKEQLDFIHTTSTDSYQGFIFSQAISEKDFIEILNK